jgi:hypothetical protein
MFVYEYYVKQRSYIQSNEKSIYSVLEGMNTCDSSLPHGAPTEFACTDGGKEHSLLCI